MLTGRPSLSPSRCVPRTALSAPGATVRIHSSSSPYTLVRVALNRGCFSALNRRVGFRRCALPRVSFIVPAIEVLPLCLGAEAKQCGNGASAPSHGAPVAGHALAHSPPKPLPVKLRQDHLLLYTTAVRITRPPRPIGQSSRRDFRGKVARVIRCSWLAWDVASCARRLKIRRAETEIRRTLRAARSDPVCVSHTRGLGLCPWPPSSINLWSLVTIVIPELNRVAICASDPLAVAEVLLWSTSSPPLGG